MSDVPLDSASLYKCFTNLHCSDFFSKGVKILENCEISWKFQQFKENQEKLGNRKFHEKFKKIMKVHENCKN